MISTTSHGLIRFSLFLSVRFLSLSASQTLSSYILHIADIMNVLTNVLTVKLNIVPTNCVNKTNKTASPATHNVVCTLFKQFSHLSLLFLGFTHGSMQA